MLNGKQPRHNSVPIYTYRIISFSTKYTQKQVHGLRWPTRTRKKQKQYYIHLCVTSLLTYKRGAARTKDKTRDSKIRGAACSLDNVLMTTTFQQLRGFRAWIATTTDNSRIDQRPKKQFCSRNKQSGLNLFRTEIPWHKSSAARTECWDAPWGLIKISRCETQMGAWCIFNASLLLFFVLLKTINSSDVSTCEYKGCCPISS